MKNIRPFQDKIPQIDPSAYIDETALIIGDVQIDKGVNIWPFVVARGDVNYITIGQNTNIQDGSVLHVSQPGGIHGDGAALHIGNQVTIGHNVILHGCKIQDHCLIGMGSIILDDVILEPYVFVGAGSVVPGGKCLDSGYLYIGSPARRIRELTIKEKEAIEASAQHYTKLAQQY